MNDLLHGRMNESSLDAPDEHGGGLRATGASGVAGGLRAERRGKTQLLVLMLIPMPSGST
jgi:hypothetical protein